MSNQHFVLTQIRTYRFTAASWAKAVMLCAELPSSIDPAHIETESTLTCEDTGEEEVL